MLLRSTNFAKYLPNHLAYMDSCPRWCCCAARSEPPSDPAFPLLSNRKALRPNSLAGSGYWSTLFGPRVWMSRGTAVAVAPRAFCVQEVVFEKRALLVLFSLHLMPRSLQQIQQKTPTAACIICRFCVLVLKQHTLSRNSSSAEVTQTSSPTSDHNCLPIFFQCKNHSPHPFPSSLLLLLLRLWFRPLRHPF